MGTKTITYLGLRKSALFEIAFFFFVAITLDFFMFSGSRYLGVAMHPFWIIVLLVSVQYGTAEGVVAAAISCAVLYVGNLPEQQLDQDLYQYLISLLATPMLWFASAVVVGELRVRQLVERQELQERLAESQEREDTITHAYKRIKDVKENLEARLAGQLRTSITAYHALKVLENREPEEVLLSLKDVVKTIINPTKFSVFLITDQGLNIHSNTGWKRTDRFSSFFSPSSTLYEEIAGRQRVLCCINDKDARVLGNEAVMAGPLLNKDQGAVFGMLKVEELGFLNLNITNVETFRILCEWIGMAYVNAQNLKKAESSSVYNLEGDSLSYSFYKQQNHFLTSLAKRMGFDVSQLVVAITNIDELSQEKKKLAIQAFQDSVQHALRNVDQAFDYQKTNAEYVIVLPGTPIKQGNIVINHLQTDLEMRAAANVPEARYSFTLQALHQTDTYAK